MQKSWGNSKELRQKLAKVRNLEGQMKDHCAEMYQRPGHVRRMEIVKSLLVRFVPGRDFVDIGCAEGVYCGIAKELGARRIVGTDIAPSKIERAKEHYPDCEFHCKDVLDIEGIKGQFDVALCSEVLQHVVDYRAAAGAIMHCVRQGGHAIFTAPNLSGGPDHISATISSEMTVDRLVEEIGGAGFGKQNALWKFNTDRLYEEIVQEREGAKLLEKIPVDTPDGQRKNLWTVALIQVDA